MAYPEGRVIPDMAELITHEHRVIDGLLGTLAGERDDRFSLAHRLIDEVAAHIAAEQQVFYPALRDIVPGGGAMANRGQEEHRRLRAALERIEAGHPGDGDFEGSLSDVRTLMAEHGQHQESEAIPALSRIIGPLAMGDMGAVYASVRLNTPSGLQGLAPDHPGPQFRT